MMSEAETKDEQAELFPLSPVQRAANGGARARWRDDRLRNEEFRRRQDARRRRPRRKKVTGPRPDIMLIFEYEPPPDE